MFKIKFISLILGLILLFPGSALAAPGNDVVSPQAFLYLSNGQVDISAEGKDVTLWGQTVTYNPVAKVSITLVLQKYSGSTWQDVNSWPFHDYDTTEVTGIKYLTVTSGKYRIKGIHSAYNGTTETSYSYSQNITVQ